MSSAKRAVAEADIAGAAEPAMTLQQAADKLGVHYMTVYKYVRTGRLPGTQEGGEWRIDPSDLAMLSKSNGKRRRGRAPRGTTSRPKQFEQQLLAGDEAGAWTVVQDALSSGVEAEEVHLAVLIPAMQSIGALWEAGGITVAEEHRASAIAQRIVGRMGPQFSRRGRKRGHIVVGAPPGDRHSMPISIFGDLLRARHFRVSELGANVPVDSFVEFVDGLPDLVAIGIGATTLNNEENLLALVGALKQASTAPVVVGGNAIVSADYAASVGADAWTGDSAQGLELFDKIARLGHVPRRLALGEGAD